MQQSQHRLHALVAVVLVATLASVSAFLHGGAEVERLLPDTSDGEPARIQPELERKMPPVQVWVQTASRRQAAG